MLNIFNVLQKAFAARYYCIQGVCEYFYDVLLRLLLDPFVLLIIAYPFLSAPAFRQCSDPGNSHWILAKNHRGVGSYRIIDGSLGLIKERERICLSAIGLHHSSKEVNFFSW